MRRTAVLCTAVLLSPFLAGLPVDARLGFYFDSVDGMFNDNEGWHVGDVVVHDGQRPPIPEPSTWSFARSSP